MEKLYEQLCSILSCELEIHRILVETANTFNKSIRENNLSEIQSSTIRHDELICQIEKLEERRKDACISIGKKLDIKAREPKLDSLIEKAPSNKKEKLLKIQKELKHKIDELSKTTISNRVLLENALNVINSTFSFYQQAQIKFEPYGTRKKSSKFNQGYTLINRMI